MHCCRQPGCADTQCPGRLHQRNGIVDTTRGYPRTIREAFHSRDESAIGITGPVVIPTRPPLWVRLLRRWDAWLLARRTK